MTPERAFHHMLMLKLGRTEDYDRELDRLLEEQDPLSPLVLELAFCMSDLRQTISVLHNFLLDHPADEAQVCDRLLADMTRRYLDKSMTAEEIADLLYRCAVNSGKDYWGAPWDRLYAFSWDLELYEDNLVSREAYMTALEMRLFCGQSPDIWALQAECQKPMGSHQIP